MIEDYTMDSSSYRHYCAHGFDSRQHLEFYLSDKPDMVFGEDCLVFPIESLKKTFKDGCIKGDILIDLSLGSLVHHLIAPSEFFNHIIVLKAKDRCLLELKRWLNTRTGAFDWGHAARLHGEVEGNSCQSVNKEEKVRSCVQHVVRCHPELENLTDPIVLPPADCIISFWFLDAVCKHQNEYRRYIRKFAGMLKPGGHLILIGDLDVTFFTVGKDRLHAFNYDENFARKVLVGEGFVIDDCKIKKRTNVSTLTDYSAIIYIVAHREK